MTSELNLGQLHPAKGSRTRVKRVGRGNASGKGTTAGRGTKGQKARTGGRKGLKRWSLRRLIMSMPKKRGFKSLYPKDVVLNLHALQVFPDNTIITLALLRKKNLIDSAKIQVKILGEGAAKRWTVKGVKVSAQAKEKIEKAGGKVE